MARAERIERPNAYDRIVETERVASILAVWTRFVVDTNFDADAVQ
jgi:hypothetical protein